MKSRGGWVKIDRSAVSDPLINKDPEYLALWVRLQCDAAFEPTAAILGGQRIMLKSGQLTTGRKQLSLNSGISESKVERILKSFENAQLIEQQTTSKNRLITILSGHDGSQNEQQAEQQMDNNRTTTEQQPNTLEEINNSKNKKQKNVFNGKPKPAQFIPPSVSDVQAYCAERQNGIDAQYFHDYYSSRGWRFYGHFMQDWKATVRTWEKNGKNRPTDARSEIKQSADYLAGGDFLDELFGG